MQQMVERADARVVHASNDWFAYVAISVDCLITIAIRQSTDSDMHFHVSTILV